MRRRSEPAEDPDSDLSISEDEDFDEGSSDHCVSLGGGNAQMHQEGIQVLFQLEKLSDTLMSVDGGVTASDSVSKRNKRSEGEDDANILRFRDSCQFTLSAKDNFPCGSMDEEIVSDDEDEEYAGLLSSINTGGCPISRSKKKEQAESASKEFKEQLSATCFKSKEKGTISDYYHQDIDERCRFHFLTDGCNVSQKVRNLAGKSENFLTKNEEYPSTDEFEDFDGQHCNQSVLMQSSMRTLPSGHVMQSFAECLDGIQDKTSLPEGTRMPVKKRKKISHGRDIEREATHTISLDEMWPDPIASGSGSSDEERNYDDCNIQMLHRERSTMAERFQEILNSTSLANVDSLYPVQKPSNSGIFGQLQRVMQSQKDTDIDFLKMMQDGGCRGKIFGDLLILSKQLDAKLTVCQCSLKGNQENPLSSNAKEANSSATRERMVIFSPRVCSSVDLEIGNLIRIYSPWLEVRVRGHHQNQTMILCTYYSQVSA